MLDTSKIDALLNSFLTDHDVECTVFASTDFAYYYASSRISYAFVVSERMNRLFLDFAKRKGLKVDCGIFLLSFLHEVGHNETIHFLEDEEVDYCMDVKDSLTDSDEDTEVYFNLIDELLATEWAINFINNNLEEVKKLAIALQKEIQEFYKKYDIEG